MIALLHTEIVKRGDKAAVVPIHRLQELRQDFAELRASGSLNNFQLHILDSLYQLDAPDAGFPLRSIILVATPVPATVELTFSWQGRRIPVTLPASYVDKETAPKRVEQYLKALLHRNGYQMLYAPQLPRKRLAVRSGLGAYGRNNICYVDGMGSFVNLSPFFSDLPCESDGWQEVRQMDLCQTCQACLHSCPTRAISPTRFLINNERCLSYFNEAGGEWDFPEWIDPAAHHTLYGCLRCQTVCPANKPYLETSLPPVAFSEEETGLLLHGSPFEQFPYLLKHKVAALQMGEYLGAIPRNLRALFGRME